MKRIAMLALVLIGCGVAPEVETFEEEDLAYATDEATKAPPEAPAPSPVSAASDGSGGGGAGSGGGGTADGTSGKTITFERAMKERRYGVRIHDQPRRDPKVIYSIRLPNVTSGEKLIVRGEVALSRCNTKDIAGQSGDAKTTPCNSKEMKQDPYGYAPRFEATFVLADKPNEGKGRTIGPWADHTCTESQHHCALAIPEASVTGLDDASEKYLNLVVAAEAPGSKARSWDVMEVEQNKGGLFVTRIGKGAGAAHVIADKTSNVLATGKLGIDQTEDEGDKTQVKRLVYRVRLDGLQPGDVIDIDAQMRARLHMGSLCDPLMTHQIILAKQPGDTEGAGDGEYRVTAKNGRNCVDHGPGGCLYEKSGAIQIGKSTPSTMYVSFVTVALRSCAAPNGADKWSVDEGNLRVGVRR